MATLTGSHPDVCPFCTTAPSRAILENALAFAILDGFPVSKGHTLVIPRRHVVSYFDLSAPEMSAINDLLSTVKQRLDKELQPDGYNLGVNVGVPAGQTIMHVHVHLIPRYQHDVDDPTGGIRNIIPGKGMY